jgi:hypothetical protein
MTDFLYTAETGLADGTSVTLANSDDGTAGFAWTPTKAAGGAITFSTSSPLRGALSVMFSAPATTDVARADITGLFSTMNFVGDLAFHTPSYPSDGNFAEVRAGATSIVKFGLKSTGQIEVRNSANALLWTSTASVNTGATGWRLGFRAVVATATTGALEVSYYATKAATTPAETMPPIANGAFGTAAIDALRIGKITSAPTWAAFWSDDWQLSDSRTTLFGGPATAADTVSAGADQVNVEPWSTVTLTATSSSGSATWSRVSGPNATLTGTGLTRTYTAPAAFNAAQATVWQATNGTASDQMSVTYLPATEGIVTSVNPTVITPVRFLRAP